MGKGGKGGREERGKDAGEIEKGEEGNGGLGKGWIEMGERMKGESRRVELVGTGGRGR